MKIQNSVFLVTGGASDDYGRATVEKLLKEGANVIICDSPTKDLIIYGDDKAIFLPINISDEKDTETLVEIIKEKYGRLDGIVNCIDVCKSMPTSNVKAKEPHSFKEFSTMGHEYVLDPFNIIKYAIPLISKNIPKKGSGRGIIINMSNVAASEDEGGMSAYAASKAAIIKMTESLNFVLQGIQIRTVSIVTNYTKPSQANGISSFFESAPNAVTEDPRKFAELVKTIIETLSTSSPMIRMGSAKLD